MNEALEKYEATETQITQYQDSWLDPIIVLEQVRRVTQIRESVMKKDEHFGMIPGTSKDTLYKAGAEILSLAFNLDAQYEETIERLENFHREYEYKCIIYSRSTGARLGAGVGSCSTLESKYRWRTSKLQCPNCGAETVFKDKNGNGWYCWGKKGGCGAKFPPGDTRISSQKSGRIENPDIADMYNTVKKIAKKRAFVDGILTVTAASGMFTQDLDDLAGVEHEFFPKSSTGNASKTIQPEPFPEEELNKTLYSKEAFKTAYAKIHTLAEELDYHSAHFAKSVKRHIGTDHLEDCRDMEKLKEYYEHLQKKQLAAWLDVVGAVTPEKCDEFVVKAESRDVDACRKLWIAAENAKNAEAQ